MPSRQISIAHSHSVVLIPFHIVALLSNHTITVCRVISIGSVQIKVKFFFKAYISLRFDRQNLYQGKQNNESSAVKAQAVSTHTFGVQDSSNICKARSSLDEIAIRSLHIYMTMYTT